MIPPGGAGFGYSQTPPESSVSQVADSHVADSQVAPHDTDAARQTAKTTMAIAVRTFLIAVPSRG